MFNTLLHVFLFFVGLVGLLAIKQRRLRHIPTRRTRIARRHAESTLWVQRLVNALLDMTHAALAQKRAEDLTDGNGSDLRGQGGNGATSSRSPKRTPEGERRPAVGDEEESLNSEEVLSDLWFLNNIKAQLEEQISALLEDKGIASFADFRINDWGGKPPVVRAVHISHGGGDTSGRAGADRPVGVTANGSTLTAPTGTAGSSNVGGGRQGNSKSVDGVSTAVASGGTEPSFTSHRVGSGMSSDNAGGPGLPSLLSSLSPLPSMSSGVGVHSPSSYGSSGQVNATAAASAGVHHNSDVAGDSFSTAGRTAESAAAAALAFERKNTTDTTRSLSVLEAEIEVEYNGNFSVSLNADLPIARGRYLQVYVSLKDVRMFAAHARLRMSLEYEPATVESPQPQPYLSGTLWLLSDPAFDVAFHSSLTQYRIRDCFLVPKIVKFLFLRFVRSRLRPASPPSVFAAAAAELLCRSGARPRHTGVSASGSSGSDVSGIASVGGNDSKYSVGNPSAMRECIRDEERRTATDISGLPFRIPLPASVVDGGEQWWSSVAQDVMSEQPVPFPRSYPSP